MITFLPSNIFSESAMMLDQKRLGNQRPEAYGILELLLGIKKDSKHINDPGVRMWKGYSFALATYICIMCNEWVNRGHKDTIKEKVMSLGTSGRGFSDFNSTLVQDIVMPPWLGDERLHSSHRSNLLRKDHKFYSKYGWTENDDQSYFWPVEKEINVESKK